MWKCRTMSSGSSGLRWLCSIQRWRGREGRGGEGREGGREGEGEREGGKGGWVDREGRVDGVSVCVHELFLQTFCSAEYISSTRGSWGKTRTSSANLRPTERSLNALNKKKVRKRERSN